MLNLRQIVQVNIMPTNLRDPSAALRLQGVV